MPISSNGLLAIATLDEFIFLGGGDGKIKKLDVG